MINALSTDIFNHSWGAVDVLLALIRASTLLVAALTLRFVKQINEIADNNNINEINLPTKGQMVYAVVFATILATISSILLYKGPGFGLPTWMNITYGAAYVWTIGGVLILAYHLLHALDKLFTEKQKLTAHVLQCPHAERDEAACILKLSIHNKNDD